MLDIIYYSALIVGIVSLGIAAHTEEELGVFYYHWWPPVLWIITVVAVPAVVQLKVADLFGIKLTWWESGFALELIATTIAWIDALYKRSRGYMQQQPIIGCATVAGTVVTVIFGAVAAYVRHF